MTLVGAVDSAFVLIQVKCYDNLISLNCCFI
jgi:hypothetical protein